MDHPTQQQQQQQQARRSFAHTGPLLLLLERSIN
jgi:hypothetical protein